MQDKFLDNVVRNLQKLLGDKLQLNQDEHFTYLLVKPGDLLLLMKELKENQGFNHLENLCAVDYGDEFEVVYHVSTIPKVHQIVVKTRVARSSPQIPSVIDVWPTADWQEREAYDLMGITFSGHPNLVRILLPDDFVGHPLRKDFTMKG